MENVRWHNIMDSVYSFAYYFVKDNEKYLDYIKEETTGYIDWIDDINDDTLLDDWVGKVVEEWGGDYEVINEILKEFYPPPKYFYLISFTKCEDFRVRIWELIEND